MEVYVLALLIRYYAMVVLVGEVRSRVNVTFGTLFSQLRT